jgi:hypothetical protein
MQRSANITAIIAFVLWLGMFSLGRDLTYHIYEQGPGIYPNSGQTDFYVLFPLCVALLIATGAWVVNGLQRWFSVLGVISAISLFLLLPFLLAFGGGV